MPKTFVMGDIHGAHKALLQCLERSAFNYETDMLICLGDVCDGWPETKQSVDELLHIKKLIFLLGNHDLWTLEWMRSGIADPLWLTQGGDATVNSYRAGVPKSHLQFFENAPRYFIEEGRLFVHAGIDPSLPLHHQDSDTLLWDRTLARNALDAHTKGAQQKHTQFVEVYLGHTPIPYQKPLLNGDVWLMDTGAGWSGVLSLMNVHSKEVFTSDPVPSLYVGIKGRVKRA